MQCAGSFIPNGGRILVAARRQASGNGMTLDFRAKQLPDESVVMR